MVAFLPSTGTIQQPGVTGARAAVLLEAGADPTLTDVAIRAPVVAVASLPPQRAA
ncbi:MAG: hypothetical protein SV966_08715 [Actinomycetota bacterium]|nr:hypothetical protein [Actinomycetota bacterium]